MEICFCLWTNLIDLTEYVNSDIHRAGLAGKAQKTLVLAALLKMLIGFLSYALIKDYLDSCVQLHGWTVERKLTTETLEVSCSQTTAQYKLTEESAVKREVSLVSCRNFWFLSCEDK